MKLEKHGNCYHLTTKGGDAFNRIEHITFYWKKKWTFELRYEICGYFDNRPRIVIEPLFFRLVLTLPFKNKWTDECNPPAWGVSVFAKTLWIWKGGKGNLGGNKSWSWCLPFFHKEWVRSSIMLTDGTWEHEGKRNRKQFYKDEWKAKQACWNYTYTDPYDGEEVPTKIYQEEREWRPKWLTWTRIFAKTRRSIDIHFSKEVGERKGSWKGGTLGIGYEMLPGEDPIDCIKRMEKDELLRQRQASP